MAKVRIGFVGLGGMGQMAHLRNYVTLDDCEVAAAAEIKQEQAKVVAQRYGIPRLYKNHKEMLAAEQLDGIVACQQFAAHAALLPDLYPSVKYVFTEKPLAVTVAAGQKLVAAAAKASCTHMVGYHKRCDPATIYARGVIDEWKASGKMGALKYVRIVMPAGDWAANGFVGYHCTKEPQEGLVLEQRPADIDKPTWDSYVSFVNYYIHQVNLMRHLLGEPYKVAYAEKSGVLMAVQGDSGVPGVIEMTPYRTTADWQESALAAFENGYVQLRLPPPMALNLAGTVEVFSDPGKGVAPTRTCPVLPPVHAMRQQAATFVKVCQGQMKPPCDAAEAVEDLKIAREFIRMRFGK